jgi:hypothetical protein
VLMYVQRTTLTSTSSFLEHTFPIHVINATHTHYCTAHTHSNTPRSNDCTPNDTRGRHY